MTVELILLTADETEAELQGLEAIGVALHELQRDTDSLFHVGVGVLCYAGVERAFKGRLRRAFPWLLKATRDWLGSPHASCQADGASPVGPRRLRRLRLSDYRLPGVRDIVLSDSRVHLVHGSNGTGKSSIAEALELVSSGTVERLEQAGEKQYDRVIRNRDSGAPATIRLGWNEATGEASMEAARAVMTTGLEDPLDATVGGSSFRLDQSLMDRLIGQFPHQRANDFLRAFFPEAKESLREYGRAAEARASVLPKLSQLLDLLDRARMVLIEFQNWRSAVTPTAPTSEDFPDLLNQWLEKTVILDLIQRERAVRATIREAREAGWTSNDVQIDAALGELDRGRGSAPLEIHERNATAAADDLEKALAAFKPSPSPAASEAAPAGRVTLIQAEALNAVSRWLFTADELKRDGLFGDKLARVINAADLPTYATLIIGRARWAEHAIKQLDQLINACRAIETASEPPPWPGQAPSSEYDEAVTAQRALLVAGEQLSARFVAKLRPEPGATGEFDRSLIAAVNELMALFTPARWGYSDISLPPKLEDGRLGLNIELGAYEQPVRAELHLNTAELNLFTVALFLLCAARVPKPLNLLLFDDPLQNMDELTSTALARGLGKVVRLWAALGRTEELLLFFNGYSDLERFRSEVGAATYRLPWLSPGPSSGQVVIEAEATAGDAVEVQNIGGMLAMPKPPGA